jgi:putative MATE family efflux protein
MKDLTKGPVGRHVVNLATFIALTMIFQTLYFLADLYFVGRLGKEAVAGVSLAGNLMFIVLALTQSMSVGATSLISQSFGRKDRAQAQLVFNQAMVLSNLNGIVFGLLFFAVRGVYARRLAADATTAALGIQYLTWFVPALFLQFPLVIMGAALRAMGDMKLPTVIQVATVLLNIVLAPVLMFGWGTGRPLGVAGAAIASLVAIGVGCVAFILYFLRPASPLRFASAEWRPRPRLWGAMLRIGLPAGGEFALMSVYMVLVYDIIRRFGAAAQAGFGIGIRVVQALFLPTVAIAFAAAPVAGQNFGAGLGARVRQTFYSAAAMSAAVMLAAMRDRARRHDPLLQRRPWGGRVRIGVSAHHLLELPRLRDRFRQLQRLPGHGEHPPAARRFRAAPAALRDAGLRDLPPARLPAPAGVVHLRGLGHGPARGEPVASAPRIRAQAPGHPCARCSAGGGDVAVSSAARGASRLERSLRPGRWRRGCGRAGPGTRAGSRRRS